VLVFLGLLCQSAVAADIVINWSGGAVFKALTECYFNAYEKATDNKVMVEQGANFAKLKAMVKSGNVQWDAAEAVSMDLVIVGEKEGILEPIDYSIIKKDDLISSAIHPYGVGMAFYSTVMAYRIEKYPSGPKNWKDFWDVKKFPGPRALENNPYNNLEFALMADGVSPDKLYPLDVDRAFRSLDRIKPHVKVWWTSGAQPAQLLTDKEVDMTSAWNGRIYAIVKKGAKVETVWNQAMIQSSAWVVPKGAKNGKLAMELIDYLHDPKRQACFAKIVAYPGPNKKAFEYLDAEFGNSLPTFPKNYEQQVAVNYQWWVENRDKVQERWDTWLLK
jgi:putative spermidine/putrescine transport system substrate-binding protein